MNRAVFLERDGILNEAPGANGTNGSPHTFAEFKIKPEAVEMVRQLKSAGFLVIATTNQSGLSEGTLSRRDLELMHDALRQAMPLDDILVCPHAADDDCPCRKPQPGLLIEAAFKWHIDLKRSFVVGDKWQDAAAARAANCVSVLLRSPFIGGGHHDVVRDSFGAIADVIVGQQIERKVRVG